MKHVYLSRRCPCRNRGGGSAGANPCDFTRCDEDAVLELSLSGFDAFGWQAFFSSTRSEGGEYRYPVELTAIDGSFSIFRQHPGLFAGRPLRQRNQRRILDRLRLLRSGRGGCQL
ncbi:MAG: hypothetical protein AB7F32_06445, partial [Victivallaceae bacterium]